MNDGIKDYCPEYPRQILNNIKQSKNGISTFAVDALFGYQNPLPENPLNLMNVFAVYNITVIQNKSAITVNLRPDEFTALARKSELVFDMAFQNKYFRSFHNFDLIYKAIVWIKNRFSGKSQEPAKADTKAAFSCKLPWGKFKGKTPGDVLLDNANHKSELLRNKELLEQNAERYPKNKDVIKAIDTAITALDKGTLVKDTDIEEGSDGSDSAVSTNDEVFLYEGTWKNKTGKTNKKVTDDGTEYFRCYRLNIKYSPLMDTYPITVIVENCFAPVKKMEDGRQNILVSQALDGSHVSNKHFFTFEEWIDIIDTMRQAKYRFGNMVYPSMYKLAVQCDNNNRNKTVK